MSLSWSQAASGAIFQAGYDVVLFEDSRPRKVGDILTVRLTESTNASGGVNSLVVVPAGCATAPAYDLDARIAVDKKGLGHGLEE